MSSSEFHASAVALAPFHLAVPVASLADTRLFYGKLLGCREGRATEHWVDYNFFGHQLTAHLRPEETGLPGDGKVDGKNVPCRHFGVVLPWETWHVLRDHLLTQQVVPAIRWVIEPYLRFEGQVGEQATMFFLDPADNALEFKAFKDLTQLFRPYD